MAKEGERPKFIPCPRCNAMFTVRALEIHSKSCSNSAPATRSSEQQNWHCNLCSRRFTGIRAFERHFCRSEDQGNVVPCKKTKQKQKNARKEKISDHPIIKKEKPSSSSDEDQQQQNMSVIHFAPGRNQENKQTIDGDHVKKDIFYCMSCRYTFLNQETFEAHQCTRDEQKSACVVCGIQVSQREYGEHVIAHVTAPPSKEEGGETTSGVRCAYCLKTFSSTAILLVHYRTHIAQFLCVDCKQQFLHVKDLKTHVQTAHQRLEQHPYHCYICMRRFSHQEAIVNHMRLHTGETPFRCRECGRSFTQIGNLQRHLNTHQGNRPHGCDLCGCRFSDPATLRNHLRTHTGEMPYRCQVCRRSFSQVGNLKRHMTKHLEMPEKGQRQRQFQCTLCDQEFSHKSTLRNHTRIHTGEQPYKCEVCPRAFSQIGNLKRHMAKHAADRQSSSSSVDSCQKNEDDKRLPHSRNLKGHRYCGRMVTRKWRIFPCPVCGKIYTWQHDLKIHYRIHSGEKPYKCSSCGKDFAQSGAIRTHQRRHHPESLINGNITTVLQKLPMTVDSNQSSA